MGDLLKKIIGTQWPSKWVDSTGVSTHYGLISDPERSPETPSTYMQARLEDVSREIHWLLSELNNFGVGDEAALRLLMGFARERHKNPPPGYDGP